LVAHLHYRAFVLDADADILIATAEGAGEQQRVDPGQRNGPQVQRAGSGGDLDRIADPMEPAVGQDAGTQLGAQPGGQVDGEGQGHLVPLGLPLGHADQRILPAAQLDHDLGVFRQGDAFAILQGAGDLPGLIRAGETGGQGQQGNKGRL